MSTLYDIKVGDKLILYEDTVLSLTTVDRVTPTQIVVGYYSYRKRDGYRVGGHKWDFSNIGQLNETNLAALEAQIL